MKKKQRQKAVAEITVIESPAYAPAPVQRVEPVQTTVTAIQKARVRQMRKHSLEFAENAELNSPLLNGLPDLGLTEPNPTHFRHRQVWLTETALRMAEPTPAESCPILLAAIQSEALVRLKVCLDECFVNPNHLRFCLDEMQRIFESTQNAVQHASYIGPSNHTDPESLARYMRQLF